MKRVLKGHFISKLAILLDENVPAHHAESWTLLEVVDSNADLDINKFVQRTSRNQLPCAFNNVQPELAANNSIFYRIF